MAGEACGRAVKTAKRAVKEVARSCSVLVFVAAWGNSGLAGRQAWAHRVQAVVTLCLRL